MHVVSRHDRHTEIVMSADTQPLAADIVQALSGVTTATLTTVPLKKG